MGNRLQQILALTPLVLVLALSAIYALFLGTYMECRWAVMGCEKLNVTSIYLPETNVLNRYPNDRTKSISDLEKQLEEKVQQKADITRKRVQKATINDELQGQIFDAAVVLKEKSSGSEPADLKKAEDSLKRAEKAKEEAKDSLELLSAAEKKFDEEIGAINTRLGELHNRQIQRYTRRLTWILFSGMFVVACVGALVVALLILCWIQIDSNPSYQVSRQQRVLLLIRTLLLLLLFVGVLIVYATIRLYIDFNYTSTFENLINLLENGAANIAKLVNFFDVMGTTIVLALVLTSSIILWHRKSFFDDDAQFGLKLKQLESRRKYLRLVLYVGTIVLVIGIMRLRVLLDWVLTYSLQPTLQTSVDDFNKVLISSLGVFYTLLLVAVYIPGRYIIINRAQSLARNDATREPTLVAAGFSTTSTLTFKELLPRIAALLAPFLVGPVAELIKTLF